LPAESRMMPRAVRRFHAMKADAYQAFIVTSDWQGGPMCLQDPACFEFVRACCADASTSSLLVVRRCSTIRTRPSAAPHGDKN
jgi:hypothetical protein